MRNRKRRSAARLETSFQSICSNFDAGAGFDALRDSISFAVQFLNRSMKKCFVITCAIFCAGCSVSSSQTPATAPAKPALPPLQFIGAWGTKGTEPGQLARPAVIAADNLGDVYIVDAGSPTPYIDKFTHDGHPLMSFTPAIPLLDPCGLTVDSGGAIYVFECRSGSLSIYFPNGDFLRRMAATFRTLHGNPPTGVAVDGDGHIYVAQASPARFARFTAMGAAMPAIPLADPKAASVLSSVSSLTGGPDGNIYAADASEHRVARISTDGALVNAWQSQPASASSAADEIAFIGATGKYVVLLAGQNSAPVVHVWTLDGQEKFAGPLPDNSAASVTISAMAVAPNGEVFLLDRAASRVFCYKINL
jgi:DNA-binding beta-propeller fold protein YncE